MTPATLLPQSFAVPASAEQVERTARALAAHAFTVEVLEDARAARAATYALPIEDARARVTYGRPSAINKLLVVNAEPFPGRTTVLLLRHAIGF
jgi:hypothetical protein